MELRPQGFEEKFDRQTLFYDAFAFDPETVVLVGPPLWNLSSYLASAWVGSTRLLKQLKGTYDRGRSIDLWLQLPCDRKLMLVFPFGAFQLPLQDAQHQLFAGKRVLYTLSRDNEIQWIADWIRFHRQNHGADAVLLYDNMSVIYAPASLENQLRQIFPEMEIHVVDWPFLYGPPGLGKNHWDSDFCQTGAFHDARFRFLARARSVLNCDVDELVLSSRGESVFAAAESAPSGCVFFRGRWVSTGTARPVTGGVIRHSDFVYLEESEPCPFKWCAVPYRCSLVSAWGPHSIWNFDSEALSENSFSYRHFRAVSTGWKYDRSWLRQVDPSKERLDGLLRASFGLIEESVVCAG
jgi:hypothetical protein